MILRNKSSRIENDGSLENIIHVERNRVLEY